MCLGQLSCAWENKIVESYMNDVDLSILLCLMPDDFICQLDGKEVKNSDLTLTFLYQSKATSAKDFALMVDSRSS